MSYIRIKEDTRWEREVYDIFGVVSYSRELISLGYIIRSGYGWLTRKKEGYGDDIIEKEEAISYFQKEWNKKLRRHGVYKNRFR